MAGIRRTREEVCPFKASGTSNSPRMKPNHPRAHIQPQIPQSLVKERGPSILPNPHLERGSAT